MTQPLTGTEYLESLRDGREVWIYGERVRDVTTHPAFRNAARMLARLYDALHDPAQQDNLVAPLDGDGIRTHAFFRVFHEPADLERALQAVATWQRLTWGWMGRTPDYKASLAATLGAWPDYFEPYAENARRWYRAIAQRVLFLNHAIVNPPVDRHRPVHEAADVVLHVVDETERGIVVSGAKVVATGSALTHHNFIAHYGPMPVQDERFAFAALVPMNAPGLKLICRPSYEMTAAVMGSPFDYPLSSRFDENDAILVFDRVEIPWENVFIYKDLQKANTFVPATGFLNRALFHGCVRLAVKLDFLAGAFLEATHVVGTDAFRGVQVNLGEVIAWRHLFWSLAWAMVKRPDPGPNGTLLPNLEAGQAYRVLMTVAYPRIRDLIERSLASALIYANSNAVDFLVPELRPYLDRYLRGSHGTDAIGKMKIMKLVWDAIGSEFGSRHELYERNFAGNHENVRLETLLLAQLSGLTQSLQDFVRACMAEYDITGWLASDLIDPADVNVPRQHLQRRAAESL